MLQFVFLMLFFNLEQNQVLAHIKLQEQFSWKYLDYYYPSLEEKLKAVMTKKFIPENNLPVGIEIWKDKLFVTVPRWRPGIPSTLNAIPLDISVPESPLLIPYPSWEFNELGNCENGLSTVYRIKVDECDRLWVLDTGTFGIGNTTQNVCPYALNVFDLNTNQRIRRYELRPEDTNKDTFIANIAIELDHYCDNAYAYMSDELGYGLIVYSWAQNTSWRFTHDYFKPDPIAGDFTIDKLNFQWGDEGIFGMSLTPKKMNRDRWLIFSPLAGTKDFAVSTTILHNMSKVLDGYHDFIVLYDRGPNTHVTARLSDANGVQLFNLIDLNAVGCMSNQGVVILQRDDVDLIFPSDIKVDRNGFLWVISDRMSTFLLSNLNYSEVNFRIFAAPLNDFIAGVNCAFQGYNHVLDNMNFQLINRIYN